MSDNRAEQIIQMQQQEEAKASNFRNLYQQVADLILPRENQITGQRTSGEDKSLLIRDPTALMDLDDMVSGFVNVFFPAEQLPFSFIPDNVAFRNVDKFQKYLTMCSEITYQKMMASNFMLQLHEALSSNIGLGTACMFSEWNNKILGLNFKDWDVSHFTFKQDCRGFPDTTILKYSLTARQAVDLFGDNAGKEVLKAVNELKNESKMFDFIHLVRPRIKRNVMLVDNINMPFESLYVNIKEKNIIEEGGYEENPYHIPRWKKSSFEKWGRGQGTAVLSTIKELQQMHKDLLEMGNRYAGHMPLEVVDANVEGEVDLSPDAINHVTERYSINPVQANALGSFPYTKEIFEMQRDIIHRAFFRDVFAPLADLPGDRRTRLEIIERVKQAMKRLSGPVYRLQSELFNPVITRSMLLLIRNGAIPSPEEAGVPELAGKGFGIEYTGELALALRDQQARAFQQFAAFTAQADAIFPEEKPSDNINADKAIRRQARSFGVNEDDLSTEEEVLAKRDRRMKMIQSQMAMQAAQTAGQAYGNVTKKPEEGSPAGNLMGVGK